MDFTLLTTPFHRLLRHCFHLQLRWTVHQDNHLIVLPRSQLIRQSLQMWILKRTPNQSEKQYQSTSHDQSQRQSWKTNRPDRIPMTFPMVDSKPGWSSWEDSVRYSAVSAGSIVSTCLDLKAVRLANITKVSASSRITTNKTS